MESTEAELDRFREQWRDEVARNKKPELDSKERDDESKAQKRREFAAPPALGSSAVRRDYSEDVEPRAYHDLPDKDERLKLGEDGQTRDREADKEPSSALEHYEKAVLKETQGQLGASIGHYRKAFKMDDEVQEKYKSKYFPPPSFSKSKPQNVNPSNASVTVPNTAHHSLHGSDNNALPSSLKQLVEEFSSLRIEPAPPPTNISPQKPCRLGEVPEEILTQILTNLAVADPSSFVRMAQVCKRLTYLVLTEESIWKRVTMGEEFGFPAMHYDFVCDIEGFSLEANAEIARYLGSYNEPDAEGAELRPTPEQRAVRFNAYSSELLRTNYNGSWRQMFRSRPRIRFNGVYISTVNYSRPGGASANTLTWQNTVHVVTYFRYLRFFRDGTVISLLSTTEPQDVVHHLIKENLHNHHGNTLPSSVMRDALRGRWRLSGPASSFPTSSSETELEGDVHIETEGVVAKYTYKMLLALAHAGKGTRNNKLAWKGFWSHNRLTDDWGEFGLRNDRAFYWSRVKSFGMGH